MLVASGPVVWISEPMPMTLVHRGRSFLQFPTDVTVVEPGRQRVRGGRQDLFHGSSGQPTGRNACPCWTTVPCSARLSGPAPTCQSGNPAGRSWACRTSRPEPLTEAHVAMG